MASTDVSSSSSHVASSSSWSLEETNSACSSLPVDSIPAAAVGGSVPPPALPSRAAERFVSSLRTQDEVDAVCRRHGVPREFTARPAGKDLRASSAPPEGFVCVYEHALEAGMRVPLHPFFREVLDYFRLAPSQITPNGWRFMAGFVVLCHKAGVAPPSLAVFRHFLWLSVRGGWYHFRAKDAARVLFVGLPKPQGWKERFFFLASPVPWPFPVCWGGPPPKSSTDLVLTEEEKTWAEKLMCAHSAAIDLRTYLCESNLAAAFSAESLSRPPPHARRTQARVKMEPDSSTPGCLALSGKKRKLEEANANKGVANSPPAAHGSPATGACSQPGSSTQNVSDTEAARKVLHGIIVPPQERVFVAAKPSDVVKSSYVKILQALHPTFFSLEHTMALEQKLALEAAVLREELEKVEAEIAEAKDAAGEAELENAKAVAVQQFLVSEERARDLEDHVKKGYELGVEHMRTVVLWRYPDLDATRLVVPPKGLVD